MKAYVLGTRGSIPRPRKEYLEYGGNTSCIYVDAGIHLILDAGSGIVDAFDMLMRDEKPIYIFLSHVHFDHICGLFSFKPFFQKNRKIHIYGECRDGFSIKDQLCAMFRPPYWPVGFKEYPADVEFHDLVSGDSVNIENGDGTVVVTSRSAKHPNKSFMYCIKQNNAKTIYALDYEYTPEDLDELKDFCCNSELMFFDSMYNPGEEIAGYGHSSWKMAVDVAMASNVNKVVMTHYSYDYTDDLITAQEKLMKEYSNVGVFAREGMILEV